MHVFIDMYVWQGEDSKGFYGNSQHLQNERVRPLCGSLLLFVGAYAHYSLFVVVMVLLVSDRKFEKPRK